MTDKEKGKAVDMLLKELENVSFCVCPYRGSNL